MSNNFIFSRALCFALMARSRLARLSRGTRRFITGLVSEEISGWTELASLPKRTTFHFFSADANRLQWKLTVKLTRRVNPGFL